MEEQHLNRRKFLIASGASVAGMAVLAGCSTSAPAATATAPASAAPSAPGGASSAPTGAVSTPTVIKSGSSTGQSIGAPEVKTIGFAMSNPNYATQAPYYIAREMGFFEQQGFTDVKIDTLDDTFQAILTGSHSFANVDTDELALNVQKGVAVRLIGTTRDKEYVIMALAPGIKTAADLKGKKAIMYTPGTRAFNVRADILKQFGVANPEKDLQIVELSGGSDAWNQALLSGQVQVATQFARHIRSVLDAGGTVLPPKFADVPQESLASSTDFIKKNPNTVANMWVALLKAQQVWHDYTRKGEIVAMMKKNNFKIPEAFEKAYFTEPDQYSTNGTFRAESMNAFLRELSSTGLLPKTVRYQNFSDLTGVYKAQQALGMGAWPPPEDQSLSAIYGL